MSIRFEIPGSTPQRPLGSAAAPLSSEHLLSATIILEHASLADLEDVKAFAHTGGLHVTEADAAKRTVKVVGTAKHLDQAFGVALHADGDYVSYAGPVSVPADLSGKVMAVLGLDTRPIAHSI